MKNKLKITERGFAGHFCASRSCLFHRNTLVEYGDKRIIVSTVGNYQPRSEYNPADKRLYEIGVNRFYETMVFRAKKEGVYWEADVSDEVEFQSEWALDELEEESDMKADLMHDKVVKEIAEFIIKPKSKVADTTK